MEETKIKLKSLYAHASDQPFSTPLPVEEEVDYFLLTSATPSIFLLNLKSSSTMFQEPRTILEFEETKYFYWILLRTHADN